ncbi:Modular serine protease [Lucilia cuprina]|nr:Modular serine protease [Lucilia cuprina]
MVTLNNAQNQCSSNNWTCDNGQCICVESPNGYNDLSVVRTQGPKCRIPSDLHHYMIFKKHPDNKIIQAGSYLEEFETLNMECTNQYTLRGPPSILCRNGLWVFFFGTCIPPVECRHSDWVCDNGECIPFNKLCDAVTDCSDGSDESSAYCFQFMEYSKHPQNETIALGSYVENFESVSIECMNQKTLRGQISLLCRDGMWNTDFPTCVGHCDGSILQGVSIQTICRYRSQYHKCQNDINPGTEIEIICAHGYKRIPNEKQHLKCFGNSSFNEIPMRCKQNCGRITSDAESLSRNGISIEPIMAPWHVSIFELVNTDYVYICSGSIVSPRIIITAAHCFWDEANLKIQMFTNFVIKAGSSTKIYSLHDGKSQIVQVNQIHIPERYRGRDNNQRDDIAFLKLNTTLIFTENIAPICIPDEILNTASSYVLSHQEGFITGFGINNQLERLKMLTLSHHDCRNKSPSDIHLANDKFCIYNNELSLVCRGDSGAGFVVKDTNLYDYEDKYRLLGVVSNTPTTKNDCTPEGEYVAVTNIFYMPWEFSRRLANAIKEDEALF